MYLHTALIYVATAASFVPKRLHGSQTTIAIKWSRCVLAVMDFCRVKMNILNANE